MAKKKKKAFKVPMSRTSLSSTPNKTKVENGVAK